MNCIDCGAEQYGTNAVISREGRCCCCEWIATPHEAWDWDGLVARALALAVKTWEGGRSNG